MKRHMLKADKLRGKVAKRALGVGVLVGAIGLAGIGVSNANATLEYQTTAGVRFTLNDSITVSVSGDLAIDELVPGNAADSKAITVSVSTNSMYGYVLQSTVGTSGGTTQLVNSDNSSYVFNSLSGTASTLADIGDGNWGYSYSLDSGASWISGSAGSTTAGYAGLPLDGNSSSSERGKGGVTLIDTSDPADSKSVQFKIGAKAQAAQAQGDYTNTVNFYAVASANPVNYMQDVATWGSTVTTGNTVTAVDKRDNKQYYVTRMKDGQLWMTQNLDYDISSSTTLTSANTDISSDWTPSTSATTHTDSSWTSTYTAPQSYDPGDRCWDGTLDTSWSTTIDTGTTTCSSLTTSPDHYHIGNYYNWTAAVAMNSSSSYTSSNTDVNQSICPAGWMLPKYSGTGSFYTLVNSQGLTSGTSGNIHQTPAYFVYGGYWYGSSGYVGSSGYYWSSVVSSSSRAYALIFDADGGLGPQDYGPRYFGYSVRCVAR